MRVLSNELLFEELKGRIDLLELELKNRDEKLESELKNILDVLMSLSGNKEQTPQEESPIQEEKPIQEEESLTEEEEKPSHIILVTLDGATEWRGQPWLPDIIETSESCYLETTPELEGSKQGLLYFRARKYNKNNLPGQEWEFIGSQHFTATLCNNSNNFVPCITLENYDGTYTFGGINERLAISSSNRTWLLSGEPIEGVVIEGESSVILANSDGVKISLLLSHRGDVYLRYEINGKTRYEKLASEQY